MKTLWTRAAALVLILATGAIAQAQNAQPALPSGVATCHHGRRHHRIPPRQRPARAAVPRSFEGDDYRERHLSRRLGRRELRRDRHGPLARAHAVQGLDRSTQRRDGGATGPRRAVQRLDELGPHQLFRDVRCERRESRVGARPRIRSHGELVRRAEGPGQRDDRSAQRIRIAARTARARAVRARDEHGLPMARLRQVADRQPQRHRERADRAPASVLPKASISPTMQCSSLPADSTKRRRSRSSPRTSADPETASACSRGATRSRAVQDGEREVDGAPRRRHPDPDGGVSRAAGGTPDFVPLQLAAERARQTSRRAGFTRRSSRRGSRPISATTRCSSSDPGAVVFIANIRKESVARRRAQAMFATIDDLKAHPITDGGSRTREEQSALRLRARR